MERIKIERAASPVEVGVSTKELNNFIQDLKENKLEYHSLMIIRHGKVAFETFVAPYSEEIPHAMYSASKSVTGTAVGYAVEEGLLGLNTKITDIFTEYRGRNDFSDKLTVKHLLTMSSGKEPKLLTDKTRVDWVNEFMTAPFSFEPGAKFRYTSENMFMLCALINKLSGQSVVDYLYPRLFEPLGIEKPFWETDHKGIESGGWGLYLKTEDLAKYVLCHLNGGIFDGKRVIPEKWAMESVISQMNNPDNRGYDNNNGYGYCFWINSLPNSYRVDGMFSQLGIVLKDYNACIIVTGGQLDECGNMRKCIWRHFPKAFTVNDEVSKEDIKQLEINRKSALPLLPPSERVALEKHIDGKLFKLRSDILGGVIGMRQGMLPYPIVFMTKQRAGGINDIKFEFMEDYLYFSWREGKERNRIKAALDGTLSDGEIILAGLHFHTKSAAVWRDAKTLELWIRPMESVAMRKLIFEFGTKKVKLKLSGTPKASELLKEIREGALPDLINNKLLLKAAQYALTKFRYILEPSYGGRITR